MKDLKIKKIKDVNAWYVIVEGIAKNFKARRVVSKEEYDTGNITFDCEELWKSQK